MSTKINKYIISGGGTGGHIYPAIAIADEIKRRDPDAQILFVGANGKIEMTKVPLAGYEIVGLDIMGLDRKKIWRNFKTIYKLICSQIKVKKIIKEFAPDVVIGVGGYASAPTLRTANKLRIPTVIQEQNSYAGVTNKMLAKDAKAICVAYEGLENVFPKDKLVVTGNPYRESLLDDVATKEEAREYFKLEPNKKTVLVLGGSLGAKTINLGMLSKIDLFFDQDIQIIWQCGKTYLFDTSLTIEQKSEKQRKLIFLKDFIDRMDLAYKAADLVVSRAGASSISELSLLHKACILIPSPNVAEDHQTKNAYALAAKNGAILLRDSDAKNELVEKAIKTIKDPNKLLELSKNILAFAKPDATKRIVDVIEKVKGGIND